MNVKKLLKKQSSAVMPSDSVKNRIKADCGACESVSPVGGGAAVKAKRNTAAKVCACCAAAVALIACAIILIKPAVPATLPDVINFGTVSSATEFYAYSAVSVGNMLDGTELTSTASAFAAVQPYSATVTATAEITDLQKKTLDKYAVFATGMLGEGKITSSYTTVDRAGYEFKLGIGYTDGFGSSAETVLYFNKVEGTIKIDGGEEQFAIKGELVKGNVSFPVEGKYETEREDDETENKIEFKAFTSLDKTSYIKIGYKHESEADETESKLVVSVIENDVETEKAIIKGETGEDTSFEVAVVRPSAQESEKEEITIKFNPFEDDGKKVMHVDAIFGDGEHKLVMQNRPEWQGGGFDFIQRIDDYFPDDDDHDDDDHDEVDGDEVDEDEDDDEKDKTDKEDDEDKEDKDDKDDKDDPPPPEFGGGAGFPPMFP